MSADEVNDPGMEQAASELRDALHETGDAVDVLPAPDALASIRQRSNRRRQTTIGVLSAAAVFVLLAGVSLALARRGGSTESSVVANQPTEGTELPRTSLPVTVTLPGTTVPWVPGPTVVDPATQPGTTSPPSVPSTPSNCPPGYIDDGKGTCWPKTHTTTTPFATTIPDTTVPTTSPDGRSTTTTTSGGSPADCGSVNQYSGWPTTMVAFPSDCLPQHFEAGTAATFHFVRADAPYPNRIIEDYLVTGLRTVRVTVDRTQATNDPHDVVTYECHALTKDPQQYYVFGNCSVVG